MSDNEYLQKICVIGSPDSLKTQFIRSFAENKFDTNYLPTLAVDITTKKITFDDIQVKLILVNRTGQEFFGKLRPSYYRGASGAIILFDKCDRQSFADIPNWLVEFQKYIRSEVPVALVGLISPCDSVNSLDEISFEEGQTLATQLDLVYFESKPTDGHKTSEIFTYLARQVIVRSPFLMQSRILNRQESYGWDDLGWQRSMNDQKKAHKIHKIVVVGDPKDRIATLLQPRLKTRLNDRKQSPHQEDVSWIHKVEHNRSHFVFHFTYSTLSPELWEEDREKRGKFYQEATGAIVVWDYENHDTIKNLEDWLTEVRDFTSKALPVLLLGIRSDMSPHFVREIASDFFETFIANPTLLDKLSDIFIWKLRHPFSTTFPRKFRQDLHRKLDRQSSSKKTLASRRKFRKLKFRIPENTTNEYLLKICVLSSVQKRKDRFIQTFTGRTQWSDPSSTAVGVDITTKKITVGEAVIKLIIPNTNDQEAFRRVRPSYYRGASALIILYDKCDRSSFEDLPDWLAEFQKYIQPEVPIALVGLITPCDENSEVVSFEEGNGLVNDLNLTYFESEPTDRQQVSEIFSYLAQQVVES